MSHPPRSPRPPHTGAAAPATPTTPATLDPPSDAQRRVLERLRARSGHLLVEAVAGAGKTSTLQHAAGVVLGLGGSARFLAFNKSIAAELGEALPGAVEVSTIHSLGRELVAHRARPRRPRIDARKYDALLRRRLRVKPPADATSNGTARGAAAGGADAGPAGRPSGGRTRGGATRRDRPEIPEVEAGDRKAARKLIDLARLTAPTAEPEPALLRALAVRHKLDFSTPAAEAAVHAAVRDALRAGRAFLDDPAADAVIDFTDMVWLPNLDAGPAPRRFAWLFVDEAQDLSAAQRGLVARCLAPGGLAVFVGDRHQAIYGFAGADSRSMDAIAETFAAERLFLDQCFRCPRSHLALAQQVVPRIAAGPRATEGRVARKRIFEVKWELQGGDLVIARTRRPLVDLYRSMRAEQQKPPRPGAARREPLKLWLLGDRTGEELQRLAEAVLERTGGAMDGARAALDAVEQDEREALRRRRKDAGVEAGASADEDADDEDAPGAEELAEQVGILRDLLDRVARDAVDEPRTAFLDGVDAWKRPEGRDVVTFATVHSAKGLGARRVFLLDPDAFPSKRATADWEREQEANLVYVALTRAKEVLYVCRRGGHGNEGTGVLRAPRGAGEVVIDWTRPYADPSTPAPGEAPSGEKAQRAPQRVPGGRTPATSGGAPARPASTASALPPTLAPLRAPTPRAAAGAFRPPAGGTAPATPPATPPRHAPPAAPGPYGPGPYLPPYAAARGAPAAAPATDAPAERPSFWARLVRRFGGG